MSELEESAIAPTSISPPGDIYLKCDFPFVYPDCTMTYSQVPQVSYTMWRFLYVAYLLVGSSLCIYRIVSIVRFGGTSTHKVVYPILLLSSLSYGIRAIDPNGYGDVLPYTVAVLAGSVNSALLYTACFTIGLVWATLLQNYGSGAATPLKIRIAGALLIIFTWSLLIGSSILLGRNPRSKDRGIVAVTFGSLAGIGVFGMGYFLYSGTQLNRRLSLYSVEHGLEKNKGEQADGKEGKRTCCSFCCPRIISSWWSQKSKISRMMFFFSIAAVMVIACQTAVCIAAAFSKNYSFSWIVYNECLQQEKSDCRGRSDGEFFASGEFMFLLLSIWALWPKSDSVRYDDDTELVPSSKGSMLLRSARSSSGTSRETKSRFSPSSFSSDASSDYIPSEATMYDLEMNNADNRAGNLVTPTNTTTNKSLITAAKI